jgi:hypothetical protein
MSFADYLHRVLPSPCFYRPFVSDGHPESCSVMVIGENPATETSADWWSFWRDDTGFNLAQFEANYIKVRLQSGKRPVSNTRLRLNRMRSHDLRCLETNVFLNEGPRGAADTAPTAWLSTLFSELQSLQVVVTHGELASRQLSKVGLPTHMRLYSLRHFRSESYSTIDRVAQEIREHLSFLASS